MSNEYSPFIGPTPAPSGPKPRELVWEMTTRGHGYRCDLLHHPEWGVEMQCFRDGELLFGKAFATKGEALAFAEHERLRLG